MRKKPIWSILFAVYLLILLRITVFRSGWYQNDFFSGTFVLIPFQTIFSYLTSGQIGYFLYLFVGNLIWFVPFGFFLRFTGMKAWKAILLTAALSAMIETLQFVFTSGCTETEDILLNTLGGVIGVGIAQICLKICKKTEQ